MEETDRDTKEKGLDGAPLILSPVHDDDKADVRFVKSTTQPIPSSSLLAPRLLMSYSLCSNRFYLT